MKSGLLAPLFAFALVIAAAPARSAPDVAVPGQKLDSGLGELPHYSQWRDPSGRFPTGVHVLGESLDDGLAELPNYSLWKDPSGRDPLGQAATPVGVALR